MSAVPAALDVPRAAGPQRPRLDVAWVVVEPVSRTRQGVFDASRAEVARTLQRTFDRFDWHVQPVRARRSLDEAAAAEPTDLLAEGVLERDRGARDFVFVLTASDLVARERPSTVGTPSRALGVAVLSTHRLETTEEGEDPSEIISRRLTALALRAFGHLAGVDPDDDRAALGPIADVTELDREPTFSPSSIAFIDRSLADVADERLEEMGSLREAANFTFVRRAIMVNIRPIADAVRRMRPWLVPFRLPRLTAAAISAGLILVTTAEAWDVAAANGTATLTLGAVAVLAATSVRLARQDRLVLGRGGRRSEQGVVTQVSVALAVTLGLLTTFVLLFLGALAIGAVLYPGALVRSWVSTAPSSLGVVYAHLAALVATLGLLIGALGASFEPPRVLRHAAYVDEEL